MMQEIVELVTKETRAGVPETDICMHIRALAREPLVMSSAARVEKMEQSKETTLFEKMQELAKDESLNAVQRREKLFDAAVAVCSASSAADAIDELREEAVDEVDEDEDEDDADVLGEQIVDRPSLAIHPPRPLPAPAPQPLNQCHRPPRHILSLLQPQPPHARAVVR